MNFSLFHFSTFTQSFVEDLKVAFEISTSIWKKKYCQLGPSLGVDPNPVRKSNIMNYWIDYCRWNIFFEILEWFPLSKCCLIYARAGVLARILNLRKKDTKDKFDSARPYLVATKGQTISEWIYEVIVSPKIRTKNCQDFCPV